MGRRLLWDPDYCAIKCAHWFSHVTFFSWLRRLRSQIWTFVSPSIGSSYPGSWGRLTAGGFCSNFDKSIPSFAMIPRNNCWFHFFHSIGGSAEAFCQNGEIPNGFFVTAGCAMLYPRKVFS